MRGNFPFFEVELVSYRRPETVGFGRRYKRFLSLPLSGQGGGQGFVRIERAALEWLHLGQVVLCRIPQMHLVQLKRQCLLDGMNVLKPFTCLSQYMRTVSCSLQNRVSDKVWVTP
jgi:hypothetical protein